MHLSLPRRPSQLPQSRIGHGSLLSLLTVGHVTAEEGLRITMVEVHKSRSLRYVVGHGKLQITATRGPQVG